ncbi:hypothetical protein [Proteiniclasticum sp.]|uniref:hypothetical protein n=1 Tax=Proteiniclasticum sp. TaxID=2053595 RepID=UPI0028A22E12|nr:hypothetical protein [Proteiniclasticum sp.]
MIIRKITEVTETQTTEIFHLICHEKDEGWELTREEMEKLRAMTERSLEDFYGRREKETVPAELYDDLYRKYNLACFQLEDKYRPKESSENLPEEVDQAEECPDYIEPPAPEVVCENGVCQLVLPEEEEIPEPAAEVTETSENLTKTVEKKQKEAKNKQRDWQKYIDMGNSGAGKDEIKKALIADKDCRASVAGIYYARHILPHVNPVKMLAPVDTTPEPGKYFTEEERLRIQKKLGLK